MGTRAQTGSPPKRPTPVLLVDFDAGEHGHRGQYNAMLARLFPIRPARFGLGLLLARAPMLCPQIEAAPAKFAIASLIRGLLGRRSVGLMLRPLPALRGRSLRLRAKRAMLKLLLQVPGAQVLTIVPFAIEPGLSSIAKGWIHDLQNWDMQLDPAPALASDGQCLAQTIRRQAAGRAVCCAIGRQEREKGFDRFAALFCASPDLRQTMLFAFGGKVSPTLTEAASAMANAGGFALDRLVSDAELAGLYLAADLVWCVYSRDYDQASGVLGRAMQHGIPVAARRGSVIAAICAHERHPCIEIDDDAGCEALATIPPRCNPDFAQGRARQHGEVSLARLAAALQTAPAWDPFAPHQG